jgi:hypothetical protein
MQTRKKGGDQARLAGQPLARIRSWYILAMNAERKEPTYPFTEKQVAEKSEIARKFIATRTRLNVNLDKARQFSAETLLPLRVPRRNRV